MTDKPVLQPGPDHPITVAPTSSRIVVSLGGRVIADSVDALELREADYPPVHYVPRKDVDLTALARTEHESYCPFKGDSAYYSITTDDGVAENAVWTYEAPYDAVAPIKDHLAFYPSKVELTVEPAS